MTDETKLEAKKKLRAEALERRKAAFAQHGAEASRKIAAHGVDFLNAAPGAIVSGFAAINDEINPAPLMTWLQAEGFRLALPVMQGRGKPLLMRAWTPGDTMNVAAWGIAEPMEESRPSIPIFCSCRCWPSMRAAIAWATAVAFTIARCKG